MSGELEQWGGDEVKPRINTEVVQVISTSQATTPSRAKALGSNTWLSLSLSLSLSLFVSSLSPSLLVSLSLSLYISLCWP